MSKVVNLEGLVGAMKRSEDTMQGYVDRVQAVLDKEFESLDLVALSSYQRPYIHTQTCVCVVKRCDEDVLPNTLHVCDIDEFELRMNRVYDNGIEIIVRTRVGQYLENRKESKMENHEYELSSELTIFRTLATILRALQFQCIGQTNLQKEIDCSMHEVSMVENRLNKPSPYESANLTPMTFMQAVEAMKDGKVLRRKDREHKFRAISRNFSLHIECFTGNERWLWQPQIDQIQATDWEIVK